MKKLFTLMMVLCASVYGYSQYYYIPHITGEPGNPGGLNADDEFPNGGGLTGGWTAIHNGSAASADWSTVSTIPFNFDFNGMTVTDYKVSTSGVLTFDVGAVTPPPGSNAALPDAAIPDNSICVWGLAAPGANDNIMVKTFGTPGSRQHWVFFASYNYDGGSANCWNYYSIVMEETTNNIYIVDQRHASGCVPGLSIGVQIDASTAFSVAGSPAVMAMATTDATAADNVYYEFIQGTQPDYDLTVDDVLLDPFLAQASAPYSITGSLQNFGAQTVTDFDLNYSINGGAAVTANITGVNIAPFGSYNYTHPTDWNPSAVGAYNVEVWATNINGNPDQNTGNDAADVDVQVIGNFVQKYPMVESFTSSTCGPCVGGNANMKTIFDADPSKQNVLKYQMSWPGSGDPYYTDEGGDRRTYYGVNSVPNVWVDGDLGINSNSLTQAQIDAAANVPAFMTITAEHIRDGQSFDLDITIDPIADYPGNNRLMVAIYENETFDNTGTNGETEFDFVMKKMLPDANGTMIGALTDGTPYTTNMTYTFQGNYRLPANASSPIQHATEHSVEEFSDLSIIIWVEDPATGDVFQSAISEDMSVGINEVVENGAILNMFPNPSATVTNLWYRVDNNQHVTMNVYNTLGSLVYAEDKGVQSAGEYYSTIDVQSLTEGIYFVHLNIGDQALVQKMVVTK